MGWSLVGIPNNTDDKSYLLFVRYTKHGKHTRGEKWGNATIGMSTTNMRDVRSMARVAMHWKDTSYSSEKQAQDCSKN